MRLRVLDRSVPVRPRGRRGRWKIIGYGMTGTGQAVYHLQSVDASPGTFRSLTRDRFVIYRRRVRSTMPTGGSPTDMAITNTRTKRAPGRTSAYLVDIKITGRRTWAEAGTVRLIRGRRWRWQCINAQPTTGLEDTKGEAVTALLHHLRTADHSHIIYGSRDAQ
jgi:hypothetical protein